MHNIRESVFWFLDRLKGSPIRSKYLILKDFGSKPESNAQALNDILEYARKNVPFYKNIEKNELSAFPVIDKGVIKPDYSQFRSPEFPDEEKLVVFHTSGSSGTPFKSYQNKEKNDYHKAFLILQHERFGWRIGNRWAHMRNWGYGAPATKKDCFIKNLVPLSVLNLNDEKLETIVKTLVEDKKLHIILGYASGLERLALYIVQKHYEDLDFGIKLIIADSDNLKESSWDLLERIFKCPVLNRYANIENGIIAITRDKDRTFYIENSQVYVEVLQRDSDVSVEPGEIGRVVITDLHNKALPFIRYDTGDLAVAKRIVNGQCMEIGSLMGREISALHRTDGTLLSETNIMGRFKEFTDIGRYQIRQKTERKYVMILENASPDVDEKCAAELKKIFGDDAEVSVEHTDCIPCKESGKFAVTVSEL